MENIYDDEGKLKKNTKNPFEGASIFSRLFFTWTFPLFLKGFKYGLKENDIFAHLRSHDSEIQGDKLERQWNLEVQNGKTPSLWRALFKVFGTELICSWILMCFFEVVRIFLPIALSRFLDYYEPNTLLTKEQAYMYAGLVSGSIFVQTMLIHHYFFYAYHLGQKIRSATSSLVYRKAIKLSRSALGETTIGQMVNLISNDVARFELCTANLHDLWMGPVELVVVLVLLYQYVGYSALPGTGLLLCFIPFQMWMGKKTSLCRLRTAIRTDERIRIMNEVITGMKVIKMYTWEKPFSKLIRIIRMKEIAQIKNNLFLRGIMMAFNVCLTRAVIASCILTFVLMGNKLSAKYVYVVSLFFEILRQSINQGFTFGVAQIAEASISVKRIKEFLMFDELKASISSDQLTDTNSKSIVLKDLSVKWAISDTDFVLKGINMEVNTGELATVVGKVGSGKSALLQAILKELPLVSGSARITGIISYASQDPWLFMASVRQNITFGQRYDPGRYHRVIRACGLERDLTLLPYGDRTLVGERGVSLSGGQKSRINLARAVYKQADIYLLDDPLSAVDTRVGRHIFNECISTYLKDKCVILITHQLQYLKHCKKVYVINNGVMETCTPSTESSDEFRGIIKELEQQNKKDGDDDANISDVESVNTGDETKEKSSESPTMEKEGKVEGKVTWAVHKSYFLAGGHWCKILSLFLLFLVSQALASGSDYFLSIWVNLEQMKLMQSTSNMTAANKPSSYSDILLEFWFRILNEDMCLIVYESLVPIVVLLLVMRSLLFFHYCVKASINLHEEMFKKIISASMRFFNINPSGRILNRFSKDMNQVDEYLPIVLSETLQIALMVAAITIVVATISPFMLIPTAVIVIIFYMLRVIFIATTRDVKRFEAITRSPVYSHLTASLQGITTIRAFSAQQLLIKEFDVLQNAYNSAYFMFLGANRTFAFWLDVNTAIFVSLVIFGFLLFSHETYGGNVGLAITQAITLTGLFQFGIRQWSEMENTMTCVERIKEYSETPPESQNSTWQPRSKWPTYGDVKFNQMSLKYGPQEPYVLKQLTVEIKTKEKIGIVGRTGAGKSSIIVALFRLAEFDGDIFIDGINTRTIPLSCLRSNISIIPQEPVLFSGTLRKNLDPFDEYPDDVIWGALDEVQLKRSVSELVHGLETRMSEGGSNFSVGERQLVCLARAIIKNNKILILDEATANVDPQTDALIQSTIRRKFVDCTVLTIAHRLNTIMDSDKVIVMDAGRITEFGEPYKLLEQATGAVYNLVQQTGKDMSNNLMSIAQNHYQKTN
ncbi:hypothetical protein GWI33_013181 [Rhynchophorus ferrugineus]|uniref:Multidrug resistance-associated protein lethal(2)03659 n=1 Tax=Rhynchophorus ferrugineus TaxID=354439 RepID=A0A834IHG6_RHYFE|nr:hypothetical protein GWI33_013181 [Rhynchophorus ferrugineus]